MIEPTFSPDAPAPAPVVAASSAPEEDVTTALYRAAIGPVSNAYYMPIFNRFEAADRAGISWNTAASLATLNWLAFRKLWVAALAYVGILVAVGLLVFGIGHLVFQFSDTLLMALGLGFGLAAFVLPGLFGNAVLHADCRKRMSVALTAHTNVSDACEQLLAHAPTRRRAVWLAGVSGGLLALAAFLYVQISALSNLAVMPQGALEPGHVAVVPRVAQVASAASAAASTSVTASAPATAASAMASAPAMSASAAASAAASSPALSSASAPASAAASPAASAPASAPALAASGPANTKGASASAVPVTAPLAAASSPTASAPAPVKQASAPAVAASHLAKASAKPDSKAALPAKPERAKPEHAKPEATQTVVHPKKTAEAVKPPVGKPSAGKPSAAASSKASAPASEDKPYFINVGLFSVPENAANAHAKLQLAQLPSVLKELKAKKGRQIRVRVGPYATQAEAQAAAEKIKALQLDAMIVQP